MSVFLFLLKSPKDFFYDKKIFTFCARVANLLDDLQLLAADVES